MRLPRFRLSIRTLSIGIAVGTILAYYVVVPTWKYYRLDPTTRRILDHLRTTTRLKLDPGQPLQLEGLFRQVEAAATNWPPRKSFPLFVDPQGLQDANQSMAARVDASAGPDRIQNHLQRALGPLGLDYYIKDGLLTITSTQATRQILHDEPEVAIQP